MARKTPEELSDGSQREASSMHLSFDLVGVLEEFGRHVFSGDTNLSPAWQKAEKRSIANDSVLEAARAVFPGIDVVGLLADVTQDVDSYPEETRMAINYCIKRGGPRFIAALEYTFSRRINDYDEGESFPRQFRPMEWLKLQVKITNILRSTSFDDLSEADIRLIRAVKTISKIRDIPFEFVGDERFPEFSLSEIGKYEGDFKELIHDQSSETLFPEITRTSLSAELVHAKDFAKNLKKIKKT